MKQFKTLRLDALHIAEEYIRRQDKLNVSLPRKPIKWSLRKQLWPKKTYNLQLYE